MVASSLKLWQQIQQSLVSWQSVEFIREEFISPFVWFVAWLPFWHVGFIRTSCLHTNWVEQILSAFGTTVTHRGLPFLHLASHLVQRWRNGYAMGRLKYFFGSRVNLQILVNIKGLVYFGKHLIFQHNNTVIDKYKGVLQQINLLMLLQSIVYKMRTYDCPGILKSGFHHRSYMVYMWDVGCFFRNIFFCVKRTRMRIFYWEWVVVMRIWWFSWQHLGFWKTVCESWFFRIVTFRLEILCMRYQKIL